MKLIGRRSTSVQTYRGDVIDSSPQKPRGKLIFAIMVFVIMGGAMVIDQFGVSGNGTVSTDQPESQFDEVENSTVTTPQISDFVLGQPDRVRNQAELDALNTQLLEIETEIKETKSREYALQTELDYVEGNALILQTNKSIDLQNQLAELDVKRGEVEVKIDELVGSIEAESIQFQVYANATAQSQKNKADGIVLEAEANLNKARVDAESKRVESQANRELAVSEAVLWGTRASIAASVLVIASIIGPLLYRHVATQVKKPIYLPRPDRAQKSDAEDEINNLFTKKPKRAPPPTSKPI